MSTNRNFETIIIFYLNQISLITTYDFGYPMKSMIKWMVLTRDGPNSSFAGYSAILKTGFPARFRISQLSR